MLPHPDTSATILTQFERSDTMISHGSFREKSGQPPLFVLYCDSRLMLRTCGQGEMRSEPFAFAAVWQKLKLRTEKFDFRSDRLCRMNCS